MNRKILILGAAGFIGSYLVKELSERGFNMVVSDFCEAGRNFYTKENTPYVDLDITKYEDFHKLSQYSFDTVIHLAGTQPANVSKKSYDPKNYVEVNVCGTLNILEYCRSRNIKRLIYATSHRNTQGLWKNNVAIKEDDGRAIKYDGEYAMFSISESAAQDCVLHYNAQYGMNGIIFRLPPVYGYGPHTEIFKEGKPIKTGFQVFIDNAKAGKPLEVWGDGSKGRDIVYIKDVIEAFLKAADHPSAKGLYNITSGIRLTLREEAEAIAKVFWSGKSDPVIIDRPEKENGMDNFLYDNSKANRDFGWKPRFSFEDMLRDFIKEGESNEFGYLLEKRKRQLTEGI